jgi:hypothetical protein
MARAVRAELEFPAIKPAKTAMGAPNIIEVINVPTVIGIKKIPRSAATMKIGNPQKDNVPDHEEPIIPIATINPKSEPTLILSFTNFC